MTSKIIRWFFPVFVLCCISLARPVAAQRELTEEDRIRAVADLRSVMEHYEFYTRTTPHEKVYLHMDKPYYTTGDTIWYKAYALLAGSSLPDTLNGSLYVDFVQQDGEVLAAQRIRLDNGLGRGQFVFADPLIPGYYMIRAYTAWMRNFTEEPLFSKLIPVYGESADQVASHWSTSHRVISGVEEDTLAIHLFLTDDAYNPQRDMPFTFDFRSKGMRAVQDELTTDKQGSYMLRLNVPRLSESRLANLTLTVGSGRQKEKTTLGLSLLRTDSLAVRFFPEGGYSVNGVSGCVAVQVTDAAGMPVASEGIVYTSSGRPVQSFAVNDRGVGAFYLTPRAGERYYAVVTPVDPELRIPPCRSDMPEALEKGYAMQVFNVDGRYVRICIKRQGIPDEEILGLTVRQGGRLTIGKTLSVRRDSVMVVIPRTDFASGVSQITLFNTRGLPLCERMVFVNRYEPLHIAVQFDKQRYKAREKIQMDVTVTDPEGQPVQADLSVAVSDAMQVKDTARYDMNLLTQMLLQSDLRGMIRDPGYYFRDSTMTERKALELLMLTQGWRRYDLSEAYRTDRPVYARHFEWTLPIRGVVRHMTLNYPLPDHQVTRLMGLVKKDAFEDSKWNHEVRGWEYKLAMADNPADTARFEKSDGLKIMEIDQTVTDRNGAFSFYTGLQGEYLMMLQTKKVKKTGRQARKASDTVTVDRTIDMESPYDTLPAAPFMRQLEMNPEAQMAFLRQQRGQRAIEEDIDIEVEQLRILQDSITTYFIPAVEVLEARDAAMNMAREMSSYQMDAEMAVLKMANTNNSVDIPSVYDILQYMYPDKFNAIESFDDSGNSSGTRYTWMGRPVLLFDLTPQLPRTFDGDAGADYRSIESLFIVESDLAIADVYQRLKGYPEYWEDLFNLRNTEEMNPVIVMYTRTQTKHAVSGLRQMLWEGYAEPLECYSPDYAHFEADDVYDIASRVYDRRSTLYWNASLKTDQEGKAHVEFYNSDRRTLLHSDIQGITPDGRMGVCKQ